MGETPEGRNLFTQNGFHTNTWNRFIEGKKLGDNRRTKQKTEKKNIFKKQSMQSPCSDKEPTCQHGTIKDTDLIPGSGRSPGEGTGSHLRYSCLENPMDRGAWWATARSVAESDMTKAT